MSDQPNNATLQTMGTPSDTGVVPKSMLATANAARSILSGLVQGDYTASLLRTRIQRKIDGFPTFTDDQVKEANQEFRARANWGGARAKIRDYETAFHDIVTSNDTVANVRVRRGDPQQRENWGQIFAEEYHDTLFHTYPDWQFLYQMELHQKQLAIHGVGPCFWRDEKDWRFYALKRRNILVPKDSPADVSRIPVVFVRDWMYVTEVFKHIRKGKGQQVEGSRWNAKAGMNAIKVAQQVPVDSFNFEWAENMWQNNAYGWAITQSKVILIAHAFTKEYSGKISHQIFTESEIAGDKEKENGNGYLYSNLEAFDGVGEALWVCFQDVGNGDFESVRGMGLEAYYFAEAQDRLNNSLIDNAIQASAALWQAETPEVAEKLTRIEIGPNRVIPSGLSIVQNNVGAAVNATLAVAQHIDNQGTNQTGAYRSRVASGGYSRTATEVEAEVGETSKLTNANVSHYCIQADSLLANTFKRLTSRTILPSDGGGMAAKDFKDRCINRGIPEELFHDLAETAIVTMCRPIGNGSYADRIARLMKMTQFIGDMPARKRAQFIRDAIAYIGGSRELADRYGPDIEQSFPGIEQTLAILENNGFAMGGLQDPFSPDNAHAVHFATHMEFGQQLLQGQPEQVAPILEKLGPHMYQHLQALAEDDTRRAEYDAFSEQFGQFMKDAELVIRQADQAGQAGKQMQEISAEERVGMAKVEADHRVKMTKVQLNAEASAQRQAFNNALALSKTRADETRKNLVAGTDIRNKTAKATGDIINQTRKTTAQTKKHNGSK